MTDRVLLIAQTISGVENPGPLVKAKAKRVLKEILAMETGKRVFRHVTCPKCSHNWKAEILLNRRPRDFGRGTCCVCKERFQKRHPSQNVCSSIVCIKERNKRNYDNWRKAR